MDKERFLDVNGFSIEYDIPLEKRMNKYRSEHHRDSSRPSVNLTDCLAARSKAWQAKTRHKQVVIAIVAALIFACIVAASVYLTYGFA